jgi:peroxiredoxin
LGQLQGIEPELIELGYQILAVSADRPSSMKATYQEHDFKYKLFSDSAAVAAAAFGIAYYVPDEYVERVKQFNIDIEAASGNKEHILPVPSVFILDYDGMIKFEYVNPNYKVRIHPEVLLAAARAEMEFMELEKAAREE